MISKEISSINTNNNRLITFTFLDFFSNIFDVHIGVEFRVFCFKKKGDFSFSLFENHPPFYYIEYSRVSSLSLSLSLYHPHVHAYSFRASAPPRQNDDAKTTISTTKGLTSAHGLLAPSRNLWTR